MIAHTSSSRALDLRRLATYAALVLAGSLLMTLGARFSIPTGPYWPGVPITLQTLALPLVVALIGTRLSVLAMFAYLAEGALGLPVFAPGAHIGLAVLLGPTATTAGYLWSYPIAAWAIGTLYDRGLDTSFAKRWLAIFLGTAIVFAFGYSVLSLFIGTSAAFTFGVAPFWLADLVKVSIAAAARPIWPKLAALLRT